VADAPWDRTIIQALERPICDDIDQAQSQMDGALREVLDRMLLQRTSIANDVGAWNNNAAVFFGDGFKVRPVAAALQVSVTAGLGVVVDTTDVPIAIGAGIAGAAVPGLDDRSRLKPLPLEANAVFNIPAPPGVGLQRFDIIEVKQSRVITNATARAVLNTGTGIFAPNVVNKTLEFKLDGHVGTVVSPAVSVQSLGYKQGAAAAVAVSPAVSPGYTIIARILVINGAINVDNGVIQDLRSQAASGGMSRVGLRFTMPTTGAAVVPTITNLIAPAGAVAVVVGQASGFASNATSAQANVYIIGAAVAGANNAITVNSEHVNTPNTVYVSSFNVSPLGVLVQGITAAEKAEIEGANASPAGLKVAVGQPRLAFRVFSNALLNGGSVRSMDGSLGDPNPIPYHVQIVGER